MSRIGAFPSKYANRTGGEMSLRCRLFGHRWPEHWGDNGCYTVHPEDEPSATPEHWHLFTRFCDRCGRMMSKFEQRPPLSSVRL